MSSWKTKVNSLCLIPELSCRRNCPNCYEKKKIYGSPLEETEYIHLVKQSMESLPSLTEVLIDYNGNASWELLITLLSMATHLKTVITTNIEGAMTLLLNGIKPTEKHISLHTIEDIQYAKSTFSKITSSYSVMVDEIDKLPLDQLGDVPFYFIYDKFGYSWSVKNFQEVYLSTIQKVQKYNQYTIDHCMQTRFYGQSCPASTQINIYRDGSIRRCPYQPTEPENADYSHGCALIRSIDGTDK